MLAQVLQQMHSEGTLTVKQIARAWKISESAVYPYLDSRWPTIDKLIDLLDRSPREVQLRLLGAIVAGCKGLYVAAVDASADINGDGHVDSDDLAEAIQRNAGDHARTVKELVKAMRAGKITEHEEAAYVALVDRAIGTLIASRNAMAVLVRRPVRARAVTTMGVGA